MGDKIKSWEWLKIVIAFVVIVSIFITFLLSTKERNLIEAWIFCLFLCLAGGFGLLWWDRRGRKKQDTFDYKQLTERPDRIWIKENKVCYESPDRGWELPISEINIIGEYTNSDGPYLDDWFIVFILRDGKSLEAPVYAGIQNDFMKEISGQLHTKLEYTLANSTNFASNILWPREISGKQMFVITKQPAQGTLGRLFRIKKTICGYSNEILRIIRDDIGKPPGKTVG